MLLMSVSNAATETVLPLPEFPLTALGQTVDVSPEKFGALRDSSDDFFDVEVLRTRMTDEGYLYLPGLLNRAEVLEARRSIVTFLEAEGQLLPGSDPMLALARQGCNMASLHDHIQQNQQLARVLYNGPMMAMWDRFFGEATRHFDFTWFRAVAPGGATPPHTDAVYMNRGTLDLYTAWTPVGDVPLECGPLMVLEGSHRHQKLRDNYSSKDVDAFCENRVGPGYTRMGGGGNIRTGGHLSPRPVTLREALGGRWLTADFKAGDVLVFSIFTVHCSLDNRSAQIRLTSDSRYQKASEPADERWIGPAPIGHGPAGKRAMIC